VIDNEIAEARDQFARALRAMRRQNPAMAQIFWHAMKQARKMVITKLTEDEIDSANLFYDNHPELDT